MFDEHPLGRPLVTILFYNNGEVARDVLNSIPDNRAFDLVLVDDGSQAETARIIESSSYPQLRNSINKGIGASLKRVVAYAHEREYRVIAVMAGNGKDRISEMDRILGPIYREEICYVQGSRMLAGGNMEGTPWFRRLLIPAHAALFRALTGFPCTDALNGFRAYRIEMFFSDPRINIWQDWLDRYEYETYLHYKMLTLGYPVKEVPVTKSYTHFKKGIRYSHIRPLLDWWRIIRPIVYLALRIRS